MADAAKQSLGSLGRPRLTALRDLLLAFAPPQLSESPAEEQLRALLATYETSPNAGDGARIEPLYAEDGVFMDELTVQGDVAYARTHSAGTATVVATGASGPEANRELFIFARGPGGWQIARYMFNKAS